jgi:hypothetical protein
MNLETSEKERERERERDFGLDLLIINTPSFQCLPARVTPGIPQRTLDTLFTRCGDETTLMILHGE